MLGVSEAVMITVTYSQSNKTVSIKMDDEIIWMSVPWHLSLGVSRHSATCHLWVCTTKMEKGIWHTGQKSPEDGSSAALPVGTVSLASKLLCPSILTTVLKSPLSAALSLLSGDLTLLEVFLEVRFLLATVGADPFIFFFFSRGLYSQMSFSESSFCDIWSKRKLNVRRF